MWSRYVLPRSRRITPEDDGRLTRSSDVDFVPTADDRDGCATKDLSLPDPTHTERHLP